MVIKSPFEDCSWSLVWETLESGDPPETGLGLGWSDGWGSV